MEIRAVFLISLVVGTCCSTANDLTAVANRRLVQPADCSADSCSYTFSWEPTDTSVQVRMTGRPSDYEISSNDFWIGFAFSRYGTMSNSTVYLCKKINNQYSTMKVRGYVHGLQTRTGRVEQADEEGTLSASYNDGLVTCTFNINNNLLSSTAQYMTYGMGPITNGEVQKHSVNPLATSVKFSLLRDTAPDPDYTTVQALSAAALTAAVQTLLQVF